MNKERRQLYLWKSKLQEEAETRYKNLVDSKKWNDDSNDAKKILALHVVVAESAKTVAFQAKTSAVQPKSDKNEARIKEKNQWKYTGPKDTEDKTKQLVRKLPLVPRPRWQSSQIMEVSTLSIQHQIQSNKVTSFNLCYLNPKEML